MTHRILITGSRKWADRHTVEVAIRREIVTKGWSTPDVVVVHGGASGADACAHASAVAMGLQVEEHPAAWTVEGRAAGPLRNQRMVDLGADICLAFPLADSRGTHDCIRRARDAGVPVRVIEAAPPNPREGR